MATESLELTLWVDHDADLATSSLLRALFIEVREGELAVDLVLGPDHPPAVLRAIGQLERIELCRLGDGLTVHLEADLDLDQHRRLSPVLEQVGADEEPPADGRRNDL